MAILKRTLLVERDTREAVGEKGPILRPLGWAIVQTDIGSGVEPFVWEQFWGDSDYDPADETAMVNEIMIIDSDKLGEILSGTVPEDYVHGGTPVYRVGR